MDYRSIINIILDQISTPFNLSIFCNGSSIGITIDQVLPDKVIQDLEAKLKPFVHEIRHWNTPTKLYLDIT